MARVLFSRLSGLGAGRRARAAAARAARRGLSFEGHRVVEPSLGVYFWSYPVFEAVGYGEIQLADTARYS